MLVNLKRDFFGPDAVQYKVLDNPHNFDDDWILPKDAKEVEEPPKPTPKPVVEKK